MKWCRLILLLKSPLLWTLPLQGASPIHELMFYAIVFQQGGNDHNNFHDIHSKLPKIHFLSIITIRSINFIGEPYNLQFAPFKEKEF